MATEPLTGRNAVEAIGLAAHLGNSDARFDGARLLRALRTRAGRLRIFVGMTALAIRAPRFHVERRGTAERRPGRSQRRALGLAAPDRPRPATASPSRENGS